MILDARVNVTSSLCDGACPVEHFSERNTKTGYLSESERARSSSQRHQPGTALLQCHYSDADNVGSIEPTRVKFSAENIGSYLAGPGWHV